MNTRVKTYDSLRELGDDEESNIQLNKLKDVAFQLIDKIASAIQYLHSKEEASELDVTIKENSKGTEIKSKDLFFKDEHKFFVGRKEYIDKIIFEAIIKPSSCVSIIGIGGSGKTQLAYQAMRKYELEKLFDLIIPVYFDVGAIKFSDFLYKIAEGLWSIDEGEFVKNTIDQNINNIIKELQCKTHPLLYLDSYETISYPLSNQANPSQDILDISNFINDRLPDNTSILLTSRERNNRIVGRVERRIELEGLNKDEAISVFSRLVTNDMLKDPDQDTITKIEKLLEKIEGHPLLIEILSKNITTIDQLDRMIDNVDTIQQRNIGEKISRLKTIEACFGYTVNLLDPKLQYILCNLLLFKSKFLPDAASSILGIKEEDIINLYNRMLLKRINYYVSIRTKINLDPLYYMYGFHPGTRTYLERKCKLNGGRTDKLIFEHKNEYVKYFDDFLTTLHNEQGKKGHLQYHTMFKIISESEKNDFLYAAEITGDDHKRRSIVSQIGSFSMVLGNYKKALEYHEKALEIDTKLDDKVGIGNDYTNIGIAYRGLGDYKKALEYYDKAESIHIDHDNVGLGKDYTNIGIAHYGLGNYKKALEYHEKALEIDTKLDDKVVLGADYTNIGIAYRGLGDYKKALEYHEKALEIDTKLDDKVGIGNDYTNIGNTHYELGGYKKALEYYDKAESIHIDLDDNVGLGADYTNIGIAYRGLGDYKKALEDHEKALEIDTKLDDKVGIGNDYTNIGIAYRGLGDYKKALE